MPVKDDLSVEKPWPKPTLAECQFYHSFDFPDGASVQSGWDIRGKFQQYIGDIDLRGRSVLDVGTASGFLAFSAEQAGAARVTATELGRMSDMDRVPFARSPYMANKAAWSETSDIGLHRIKNSFWYAWHSFGSRVEASYGNLQALLSTPRRWDVVIAGAILEHLENQVSVIGSCCRVAQERAVIGFTPVDPSSDPFLCPISDWTNSAEDYVWWLGSRGLYDRVFENMGFKASYLESTARLVATGQVVHRTTIVAERV